MKLLRIIHTILFFIWMWFVLLLSIVLLIPLAVLSLPGLEKIKTYFVLAVTKTWATQLIWTAGASLRIHGLEHIPYNQAFCVIGNHQSNFDIPILMAILPQTIGFVGKHELKRVPFISSWMRALGCVFIDRKNLRSSIGALQKAADQIQQGRCMVIFPEGTRSRSGKPGKFNSAGIRMLARQEAAVLPISISNSRNLLESNGYIHSGTVDITIHPLRKLTANEATKAAEELETLVTRELIKLYD